MASGAGGVSKRLIASYIIDWIIIIAIAAVGAAFSTTTPNKRPFDVTDPALSFPYVAKEKISTGLLFVIGLIIPAVVTFVVCVFIGLGPLLGKRSSRSKLLKRKLWEWHAAWLGLAFSLAIAFFLTNGSKNLFGKPRPDLLARCDPDLSRLLSSAVGGVGSQVDEGKNLVSWTICRNPGSTLDDGFRSFPSGHSSFSFAGMTYLALFLCAKLAVAIPFLNYHNFGGAHPETPARRQAAAPPIYLIVFPLIPICLAIYVSSTRYSDFMHHGFDIISGAILGIASAWLGFRFYHMPITRGGGWAWAPRSYDRAFGKGFGTLTYVNNEATVRNGGSDLERGHVGGDAVPGNGLVRGYKTSEGSEGIHLADMNGAGLARESDSSRRPLR